MPVNGDQVRDTWFCPARGYDGYDAAQVDDLIRRVATELDAARAAGPVVENVRLGVRRNGRRYDIDAVDWFLGQFLRPPGQPERAGSSDDPWRDLPVTQLALGREGDFTWQCEKAWRDFGQLRGTLLRWELAKKHQFMELWTADRQKLASRSRWISLRRGQAFSVGEKNFTLQHLPAGSSPSPDFAALPDPLAPYNFAHPAKTSHIKAFLNDPPVPERPVRELVDETGALVLYVSGTNYNGRAFAFIGLPDHRWLRCLVRGTRRTNAIMTAVDQTGKRVARYRFTGKSGRQERFWSWGARSWSPVEIIVHPDRKLTDELALTLALSADWLGSYFERPSEGG